jgi:hypothetical protein
MWSKTGSKRGRGWIGGNVGVGSEETGRVGVKTERRRGGERERKR